MWKALIDDTAVFSTSAAAAMCVLADVDFPPQAGEHIPGSVTVGTVSPQQQTSSWVNRMNYKRLTPS